MTNQLPLQTVTIDIKDFAMPRDLGVGRCGNRVIFVPGAVPGDRVRVELSREGKGFAYGRLLELENPSPWRRDPPCPHFGQCGGCSLLHFDYGQQLEIKRRHLIETFRRVGGLQIDPEIISPVTPSNDHFFYRGKIELTCHGQQGQAVLGLRRRLSPLEPYTGEAVPIESCAIFSPVLEGILPVLRVHIRQFRLPAFDEKRKRGFLKGITVRESKSTGQVMVTVETSKGPFLGVESLAASLRESISVVRSLCWQGEGYAKTLDGPDWIEEDIEGLSLHIGPDVFYQPNPRTARLLYQEVVDFARSREAKKVMGLYCGIGSLEMVLSRSVEWIEGYDGDPRNIGSARHNVKMNGLSNCRFHVKRIEEIAVNERTRLFDLVVTDPPRTGMSKSALSRLLLLNPPAIAYVSCDPATLARDLTLLVSEGYLLTKVRPFDFFPHTSHLETLVLLQRG